ncbi:MAG: HAD family hydrolase [Pseudomonadota bacterium]
MRCVVFDLDGTLADTSADLIAAANACFTARGAQAVLDPVADARTAFRGGRAMLRLGYGRLGHGDPAPLVEADYPRLLEHYAGAIDVHTRLYPGAVAALDRLAARGDRLAICTNKPEGLARTLVARLGIADRFHALLGADTLPVRKPDPEHLWQSIDRAGGDRARAVLIGDTETDRGAARNASVPCVLVTFGPDGDRVAVQAPAGLLQSYDDLEAVIDPLLP